VKIILHHPHRAPRLSYIAKLIFEELLGLEVDHFHDEKSFIAAEGAKINYSKNSELPGVHVYDSGLLREKGVRNIALQHHFNEETGLDELSLDQQAFDLFAAAFYLVSRYEEYLPHRTDEHSRYLPEQSAAMKFGFLNRAVVNRYALHLKKQLERVYPSLSFKSPKYQFISTVDIDSAYAYKEKGLMRFSGGIAKDLIALDFTNLKRRLSTQWGGSPDPYDTYEEMDELHRKYKVEAIFFFLMADYGHNDKGLPWRSKAFQSLIKSVNDRYQVGIHPGYQSNQDPVKLKTELTRLRKITHRKVHQSRQHFLMLRFPYTYRQLLSLDISDDYTMGYAQHPGFRASIASSFLWYDLDAERSTKLRIHPFTFMDATLNRYLKWNANEVRSKIKPLIDEVKKVNGTGMSLWHNESLSGTWFWKGWEKVLDEILQEAQIESKD
jgi:hypothetical protein